jgi:hypothetical protein
MTKMSDARKGLPPKLRWVTAEDKPTSGVVVNEDGSFGYTYDAKQHYLLWSEGRIGSRPAVFADHADGKVLREKLFKAIREASAPNYGLGMGGAESPSMSDSVEAVLKEFGL